jgi:acetyl-CoA acetyltransferase
MLAAAETVAGETGISRRELDELTALRSDQYAKALADDHAFQRRYMVEIQIPQRRKPPVVIDDDEASARPCSTTSPPSRRPPRTGCTLSPPRPTRPTAPPARW